MRHPQEFEVGCGVWLPVSHLLDNLGGWQLVFSPGPSGPLRVALCRAPGLPGDTGPAQLSPGPVSDSLHAQRVQGTRPSTEAKVLPAGAQALSPWGWLPSPQWFSQGGAGAVSPPVVVLSAVRLCHIQGPGAGARLGPRN